MVWAPTKHTGFESLHELADEHPKSEADPKGGTAGQTSGAARVFTKENYRSRSAGKDRSPTSGPSSGLTAGTHIIYQMGRGGEMRKDVSYELGGFGFADGVVHQ